MNTPTFPHFLARFRAEIRALRKTTFRSASCMERSWTRLEKKTMKPQPFFVQYARKAAIRIEKGALLLEGPLLASPTSSVQSVLFYRQ